MSIDSSKKCRRKAAVVIVSGATLAIGSTDFDGLWSPETRSYKTLDFRLNKIAVRPREMAGAEIGAAALGMKVAKEGTGGATESRIALSATDLVATGFTEDDVTLKRLEAELKANGEEPVDLYAVIARFAVLSMIQSDRNQLLQFAESLRVKSYDTVSLGFTMGGLDVTGSSPARHLAIASLTAIAGIDDMTSAAWGKLMFGVDAAGVSDTGYGGAQRIDVAKAHIAITGGGIPIGATLNAISGLQSLGNSEPVRILATDLLDGFLNIGSLAFDTTASDMTVLPLSDKKASYRVGSYSTHLGLDGFRDGAGRVSVGFAADDMDLSGMAPRNSLQTAVDLRVFQTLNPTTVRYDLAVSELDEALLRRLMTGLAISSTEDLASLSVPALTYLMAMKPVVETTDARFVSQEVDFRVSGKVRAYPAWAISALPYEGTQRVSLSGYDKLLAMLDAIDPADPGYSDPDTYDSSDDAGSSDKAAFALVRGLMATMKALSKDQTGRMVWDLDFPEARVPLFQVNDLTLRYPDIASYLPLLGMRF